MGTPRRLTVEIQAMRQRAIGKGCRAARNVAAKAEDGGLFSAAIVAHKVDEGLDCRLHAACRKNNSQCVENALFRRFNGGGR